MLVPAPEAERARAILLELVPEGFEERERDGAVELAAYVAPDREASIRGTFATASAEDVEPGWEHRWREFHVPARVGVLWVGPPWASPDPGTIAVVVDPGLAFGTGSHPTTRLCLELLLEQPRGSLLDLGCGSGVLAIAAAKLGFAPVRAVDSDPHAVEAARANARANGVAVEVERADASEAAVLPGDVAIANIALDVVEDLADSFRAERVVTAGYLEPDSVRLPCHRLADRRVLDGWAAELHIRE